MRVVANPPDAGLYHRIHKILLGCRQQLLLRLLIDITYALEGFYANKVRPMLGFRCSEKYLAYSWILTSALLSPGRRVLDIGCGDSLFPSKLASLGHQTCAIDLSSLDCVAANDSRVNFVQCNVCDMPFESGQFDVMTAISTLEHIDLDKMKLAVKEISRVLHKDGILFVTMPDCGEAITMRQLLMQIFRVLSHEHRILSAGVGVTFLLLTTLEPKEPLD